MVIDHTDCLHESISDGGAAETETSLFECFAHHSGFLCFSRNFVI